MIARFVNIVYYRPNGSSMQLLGTALCGNGHTNIKFCKGNLGRRSEGQRSECRIREDEIKALRRSPDGRCEVLLFSM